jgi:predicted HTH domain antitoxin
MQIQIDCPEELLASQDPADVVRLAQQAFLVRLYQLGQVSSGRAAEILDISRREFFEVLGEHGVSLFDENMDLDVEARRGR